MPQGPIAVAASPTKITSITPSVVGSTKLNITAATVVKAAPGTVLVVNVVVKGSADGFIHDAATTGTAAASNAIATLSSSATGSYVLYWPAATGITVVPGTGQTITVSYE